MEERVDEGGGLLLAERSELDRTGTGPVGTGAEQLGPCGACEENRCPREADEVFDEVQESRFGPMEVVDDGDEGSSLSQPLGEDARGPEDLLRPSRFIGGADCAEQPFGRQRPVGVVGEDLEEP